MGLEKIRTLIVDDHALMRDLLATMLRSLGVTDLSLAPTVVEARRSLMDRDFDLLIVDYEMPNASGLELVRWARKDPASRFQEIPIIMVTAHTDPQRVTTARDAGVTEVLTKPLSAQKLMTRLISVVDQPRAFVRCADFIGPDRRRSTSPFKGKDRRLEEEFALE